jgi:hypothetical protein
MMRRVKLRARTIGDQTWAAHRCDICGLEFDAWPELPEPSAMDLDLCHIYPCPSYDPALDPDVEELSEVFLPEEHDGWR